MRDLAEIYFHKYKEDGKLSYAAQSVYKQIIGATSIIDFLETNIPEEEEWINIYKDKLEVVRTICKL